MSKNNSTLVPKLRFEDFEGEWEEKRLGEVSKIYDGTHQTPKYVDKGIPFYSVEHITANQFKKTKYITNEVFEKENKRVKLEKGDVLMTRIGDIGTSRLIDWNVSASFYVSLALIKSTIVNTSYLNQYITASFFQNELWSRTIHVAFPKKINLGEIGNCKLNIPTLPEQQKIASFLTSVDNKIQLLQQKKQALAQYKKGAMQQMFSYETRLGESKLRKGSIGDFGFFYYGKGAPKTTIVEGAETPCVRYGELYSTYKEEIKEIKSYTTVEPSLLKLSKGGEVLVPRVGEDPLEFANCSYLPFADVAIGEMISVYNTDEDGLFMTYYFNSQLKKELAKKVEGGNVSNLYFRYVEKIQIEIPSLEEQQKIASFLSKIDASIAQVSTAIQQTQEFKKGLLQQLFV